MTIVLGLTYVKGIIAKFYECLLRMFDQDGELLPAGEFLPIAEKMGLIRSIDRFVLDVVVGELRARPDVCLALNISSLSTTDPSWLRALTENAGAIIPH